MVAGKHAFCIMVHEKWSQLQKLIDCIDDERNDIFLHVDAKSYDEFLKFGKPKTQKSHLHIIDKPVSVAWSDVSLSDAEVLTLKSVLDTGIPYAYTHFLSGADLPLVNMTKIHDFFEGRSEEFVDLRFNPEFRKRLKYYHFFVKKRKNSFFYDNLRRLLLIPQLLFVNRLRTCPLKYAYGSFWFSITYDALREVVGRYDEVRKYFVKTTCGDEHYIQMILCSSPKIFVFAKEGNLRYVIFDKGAASPRILSMKEYDDIIHSGCLFARKFQEGTEVYEKMCQRVCSCK